MALATEAFAFGLADRRQRGHRRLAAAAAYLRSAGHTGAVSACRHAAAALVWPGSIRHLSARRGARVDARWAAQAEAGWGRSARRPRLDLYSATMARSTSSLAARRAGSTAATTPASAASTTTIRSVPKGTVN